MLTLRGTKQSIFKGSQGLRIEKRITVTIFQKILSLLAVKLMFIRSQVEVTWSHVGPNKDLYGLRKNDLLGPYNKIPFDIRYINTLYKVLNTIIVFN